MKKLLLALFLALTPAVGAPIPATTIFNAALVLHGSDGRECSATIVAKTLFIYKAVTAGHCFRDSDGVNFSVSEDENSGVFAKAALVLKGDRSLGQDFAVIRFMSMKNFPVLEVEDIPPGLGFPVASVTNPERGSKRLSVGFLIRTTPPESLPDFPWNKGVFLQLPNMGEGSSGGGVVDTLSGRIFAIVIARSAVTGVVVGYPISRAMLGLK